MTAQIGDIYRIDNKLYSFAGCSNWPVFNPVDCGFHPGSTSTANYRGYNCDFKIVNEQLFLEKLVICDRDFYYPDLNGVPCDPPCKEETFEEVMERLMKEEWSKELVMIFEELKSNPETTEEDMEYCKNRIMSFSYTSFNFPRYYRHLHMPVPYTGELLLGDGFLPEYYIHHGFQQPHSYSTLLSFSFTNGHVVKEIDVSGAAEEIRNLINEQKAAGEGYPHPSVDYFEELSDKWKEALRWYWEESQRRQSESDFDLREMLASLKRQKTQTESEKRRSHEERSATSASSAVKE